MIGQADSGLAFREQWWHLKRRRRRRRNINGDFEIPFSVSVKRQNAFFFLFRCMTKKVCYLSCHTSCFDSFLPFLFFFCVFLCSMHFASNQSVSSSSFRFSSLVRETVLATTRKKKRRRRRRRRRRVCLTRREKSPSSSIFSRISSERRRGGDEKPRIRQTVEQVRSKSPIQKFHLTWNAF